MGKIIGYLFICVLACFCPVLALILLLIFGR